LLAVLTIVVVPLALPAHALGAVPGQLVGDSNVESNADSDPAGAPEAFQYAATASGSAHRIHVYLDQSSAATTIVAGLYRDNNGTPGTLLAQGSLATPAAGAWNSIWLSSGPALTSGTKYWIALLGVGGTIAFRDQLAQCSPNPQNTAAGGYSSLPSSWQAGTQWPGTCSASMYAITTTSASGQLVGDSNVESTADSDPAGAPEAFQYAATVSGSAHAINLYLDQSSAATTVTAGLYSDSNGVPGTLLAQGSLATPAAGGWNSIWLNSSAPVTQGTKYWLALLGVGGTIVFRDQLAQCSPNPQNTAAGGYSSLPSSWQAGAQWPGTCSASMYITVPTHTETWAYDDGCNGGTGASATLVRQWLNYAENSCGSWTAASPSKSVSDCHSGSTVYCSVMPYVDTNLVYNNSPPIDPVTNSNLLSTAAEDWYLHEPSPNQTTRITSTAYGGGFLMNQNDPAYQSWWQSDVNHSFPGADGLFMDDQSPYLPLFGLSSQYSYEVEAACSGSGCPAQASITNLQSAHGVMSSALINNATGAAYPQIDNTLPDCGNPYETAQGVGPTGNMITGPVIGLLAEGCPIGENGSGLGVLSAYYADFLDDVAWVEANTAGTVVFLSYGQAGATTETQDRLIQEATELLGYKAKQMVSWPELEKGNGDLSIFPESGIYPTAPIQTMTNPSGTGCLTSASGVSCTSGGHNSLQVVSGVYRREFSNCFNQGVSFGPCAAIVNTTGGAVTVVSSWLTKTYHHSITLMCNGSPCSSTNTTDSDVQQGGTISLTGASFAAGTTQVPADSALLLSP
jgi:hypothetical protein